MSSMYYASLWPGLAAAWYRGQLRGLSIALMFAWSVVLLLLATFVWPAWLSGWVVVPAWILVAGYWVFEVVRTQFSMGRLLQDVSADKPEQFASAQTEYLRGNWFEAEAQLLEIIREHPSDIAASLLLVGVLRRTKRWRPALRRLEQLALLDAANGWQFEILRERELIRQKLQPSEDREADPEHESDSTEDFAQQDG